MKYCQKCGNQLPDDAQFCGKCGAKVGGVSTNTNYHNNYQPANTNYNNGYQPANTNYNNGYQTNDRQIRQLESQLTTWIVVGIFFSWIGLIYGLVQKSKASKDPANEYQILFNAIKYTRIWDIIGIVCGLFDFFLVLSNL